jgi:hypothetical protein
MLVDFVIEGLVKGDHVTFTDQMAVHAEGGQ